MAYCTMEDIQKQVPEAMITLLTDDSLTGGADADVTADAIAAADAEIDAWVSGRYRTPFDPVPDVIRKVSVDIAIYNLYSRRDTELPDARKDRYRAAVKLLESIAKGVVTIGAAEAAPSGATGACFSGPERLFTRKSMEGAGF